MPIVRSILKFSSRRNWGGLCQHYSMEVPVAPTPAECCGSGCDPCVWDLYFDKLESLEGQKVAGDEVQVRSQTITQSGIFDKPQNCVRVRKCDEGDSSPHCEGIRTKIVKRETFGSLHHVRLQASDAIFRNYETVLLQPRNDPTVVTSLIKRLGFNADDCYEVRPNAFSAGINAPLYPHWIPQDRSFTVFEIFSSLTDICGMRSAGHEVLNVLSEFCTDDDEKSRLLFLSSREGLSDYRATIRSRYSNLITILNEYESCKPPLARLLCVLPQLSPRPYSCCCSVESEVGKSNECDIYFTGQVNGVCTTFLTRETTDEVYVFETRPSEVPTKGKHVIITMGSGISYSIAFLRDVGVDRENLHLFHGCRTAADLPPEVTSHQNLKVSVSTVPRASCTLPKDGSEKYVWGLVWDQRASLLEFSEDPAFVFHVCGSAQMVNDTCEVMKLILTENSFNKLVKENRWIVDHWGGGGAAAYIKPS
eukprot:TRINITY_DN4163_c0_g1_i1.p1 TRINITY_DN4163_c0_g1~~TRINITY_DN4163_c0_g1_i1.p1  ORF type:complete len:478 (+),score=65.14 TRINITY_DN4163_c0_g1_i1:1285-2718(+)